MRSVNCIGDFFHSCCLSLKMLKTSKMLLLSSLESLIHDPISDLKKAQSVTLLSSATNRGL